MFIGMENIQHQIKFTVLSIQLKINRHAKKKKENKTHKEESGHIGTDCKEV